jgi:hypothetical protein
VVLLMLYSCFVIVRISRWGAFAYFYSTYYLYRVISTLVARRKQVKEMLKREKHPEKRYACIAIDN